PVRAEDARVLPKGRTRLSVLYGSSFGIRDLYNDSGEPEALTQKYNIDLNSKNLAQFDKDVGKLIDYLNKTGDHYNVNDRDNIYHGVTRDPRFPTVAEVLSRGALAVDAEAH